MAAKDFDFNIKPLLGEANYSEWASQMRLLFKAKGVNDFLLKNQNANSTMSKTNAFTPKASQEGTRTRESKDAEAQLLILAFLSSPVKSLMMKKEHEGPKALWEEIEESYSPEAWDIQYDIVKAIMSLKIEDFKTIGEYLREYSRLTRNLTDNMAHMKIFMLLINLEKIDQMKEWVDKKRCDIRDDEDEVDVEEVLSSAAEKANFRGL